MAMFKSKKTYIKRYASKGADKKITFSPSVKSSFNSVSSPSANNSKPSAPANNAATATEQKFQPMFAVKGTERKNIYSEKTNTEKSFVAHGTVITGAGIPKPEPIDKPDLSGVRTEANVRPIADPREAIHPAARQPIAQQSEKIVSEYRFNNTNKAETEKPAKELKSPKGKKEQQMEFSKFVKQNDSVSQAPQKMPVLDVHGIMSEIPKKDDPFENLPEGVVRIDKDAPKPQKETTEHKAQTENQPQTEKPQTAEPLHTEKAENQKKFEKVEKRENIKKAEKIEKTKKQKSSSNGESFGKAMLTALKIVLLLAIVGGCGFYGYRFYTEQIAQKQALDNALAINYAPEDYILPETPQSVAQANAQARDAAYKQAMKNAYVPAKGEVPNLFVYDYVKTCYLTFDDGPSGAVTQSILDTLKKYDVKATFFLVGKNAQNYPDLVKRMYNEGHSLGNHSYSHDYGYMYSGDPEFDEEMNRCKDTINNILGTKYNNLLFRFPGGSFEVYKSFYIYNIQAEGYQYVDWTALTGDAETQNPDKNYIMDSLKKSTNDGTKEDIVVLMHDAGAKQITADTLPDVIEYLKSKNYVFKPIYNSNYKSQ